MIDGRPTRVDITGVPDREIEDAGRVLEGKDPVWKSILHSPLRRVRPAGSPATESGRWFQRLTMRASGETALHSGPCLFSTERGSRRKDRSLVGEILCGYMT